MSAYLSTLLWLPLSLLVTVVVECGLSLIWKNRQLTWTVLAVNLLTNPLLNLILLLYSFWVGSSGYLIILVALELVVVVTEALIIHRVVGLPGRQAGGLSLLFNTASFCVGLLFWLL
ncbi:MAG: hypothetical protein FWC59_02180 [Actinomycetia bacterium]|nr:hypothetical protein [Actinomycetes bacterium]